MHTFIAVHIENKCKWTQTSQKTKIEKQNFDKKKKSNLEVKIDS